MIRVDASARTVVAVCTECPPWRALTMDRAAALRAGADHAAGCHGDHDAAAELRRRAAEIRK